jgi:hypothetical protein
LNNPPSAAPQSTRLQPVTFLGYLCKLRALPVGRYTCSERASERPHTHHHTYIIQYMHHTSLNTYTDIYVSCNICRYRVCRGLKVVTLEYARDKYIRSTSKSKSLSVNKSRKHSGGVSTAEVRGDAHRDGCLQEYIYVNIYALFGCVCYKYALDALDALDVISMRCMRWTL